MCDCIKQINEIGKRDNETLDIAMFLDGSESRVIIHMVKDPGAPRGKKPKNIIPEYCPFCGVKYPELKPRVMAPGFTASIH